MSSWDGFTDENDENSSKPEKNPLVQCVKCRNLWYAVAILTVASVLFVGYTFLSFDKIINTLIVFDLFRYVGLLVVLFLGGLLSFHLFKQYCFDKTFGNEYRRDTGVLFGACVLVFGILIGLTVFSIYLPTTLAEYDLRSQDDIKNGIIELPCDIFRKNTQTWSSFVWEYDLWDWNNEEGMFKRSFDLDLNDHEPKWLYEKFKECAK